MPQSKGLIMRTLMLLVLMSVSVTALADQSVRGYVRKDGTYVAPYIRSSPNSIKLDNYSSHGNSNPYTGQRGYAPNELSPPPTYYKPYTNPYSNPYSNPYNSYGD